MKTILNFFKKIIKSARNEAEPVAVDARVKIYSRAEHNISRSQISEHALKVLYRLQKEGFDAYLVGGCVRDLLLGREPKDFDVVTNADPDQVRKVFRNCRLIGRRFRLAHVHFGREIIEVATFRGAGEEQNDKQVLNKEGRLLRDNVYGTIEEDVWRRDFTVNALYYNIKDFSVVDYVGGMADHKTGTLKLIGDPEMRFREDPVRMLRAVRFAVKLGFKLDRACEKAIHNDVQLLASIPSARLYDEALKLFLSGYALQTFEMLRHYGLFQVLFPSTENSLAVEENGFPRLLLIKALENSDKRIAEGKTVTAYFLLAAFLWEPVRILAKEKMAQGEVEFVAYQDAASEVIARQIRSTALPRHISMAMREVWNMQPKFNARIGSKPSRLIGHPRFRAGYDFLVLRAETGGADPELAEWWTKYQNASENEQRKMTQPPRNAQNNKSGRKRSYPRKGKDGSPKTES
ncbi:MAG: polynucleotide adenylyltransferase PcnB [Methylobacter sp.]|uniref:polynucleotide adenylyltransferase PcnB n=1 Tax=Methylobacter sp. TaxID=2051955 RepID=UPI002731DF98|nr:polynucleotide adenylyltransferase PcnB [Methylobacter sp.]MDP1663723.1 polynucleotide adenylyltransferase PcnB [Methylobacter sp.]MDP1971311.1 polynucleotide adenylyltransferase PcnB [Methylobacter sp.]